MIKANKNLGQNWLIDKNIVKKMLRESRIDNKTNVIEIGSGIGALSNELLKISKKLVAIEIDRNLCDHLSNQIKSKNFELICDDYLKIDLNKLILKKFNNEDIVIISNLPYYITSKILFKNIEYPKIKRQILMVQKEYGERIMAKPNTKSYSRLTVSVSALNNVKKISDVKRKSFVPTPKVDSMIIEVERKINLEIDASEISKFQNFIKDSFATRRKTIRNNLKGYFKNEIEMENLFKELSLDLNNRPENIAVIDYIHMFNKFNKL